MKIENSGKCPYCTDSMGRPTKVVGKEEGDFTQYQCVDCSEKWLRPHNPD
jgi:DNA-directed RNA polymerase subunit RPC12/RpoP